jgi:hypothetical protein
MRGFLEAVPPRAPAELTVSITVISATIPSDVVAAVVHRSAGLESHEIADQEPLLRLQLSRIPPVEFPPQTEASLFSINGSVSASEGTADHPHLEVVLETIVDVPARADASIDGSEHIANQPPDLAGSLYPVERSLS